MPLKDQISSDVKNAMRAGDARRRDALRLITAALKQKEVDERKPLADTDVVAVIDKMIKQRRDSIAQFEKGGRQDLAVRARVTSVSRTTRVARRVVALPVTRRKRWAQGTGQL